MLPVNEEYVDPDLWVGLNTFHFKNKLSLFIFSTRLADTLQFLTQRISLRASLDPVKSSMKSDSDEDEDDAFFDAPSPTEEFESATFCVSLPNLTRGVTPGSGNRAAEGPAADHATDESLSCYTASSDEGEDEQLEFDPHSPTSFGAGDPTVGGSTGNSMEGMKVVRVITRKPQPQECRPCKHLTHDTQVRVTRLFGWFSLLRNTF
jgi:hypothetical protein